MPSFDARLDAPIDWSKPHNYPIVFGTDDQTHYLDRYAGEDAVTLCGLDADPTNFEADPMGYYGGIECAECQTQLVRRVHA